MWVEFLNIERFKCTHLLWSKAATHLLKRSHKMHLFHVMMKEWMTCHASGPSTTCHAESHCRNHKVNPNFEITIYMRISHVSIVSMQLCHLNACVKWFNCIQHNTICYAMLGSSRQAIMVETWNIPIQNTHFMILTMSQRF